MTGERAGDTREACCTRVRSIRRLDGGSSARKRVTSNLGFRRHTHLPPRRQCHPRATRPPAVSASDTAPGQPARHTLPGARTATKAAVDARPLLGNTGACAQRHVRRATSRRVIPRHADDADTCDGLRLVGKAVCNDESSASPTNSRPPAHTKLMAGAQRVKPTWQQAV